MSDALHLKQYQYQPKERAAAKIANQTQYFTGRPCKNGHIDFRCTSSGSCMTCAREMHSKFLKRLLLSDPDFWKKRYAKNPELMRKNVKNWRERNPERVKEISRKSVAKRRAQRTASQVARQASKVKATPKWLTKEHYKHIELFYEMSKRTTNQCGFKCHVDHIVPLKGKNVCGLHVPWNLRVVSAEYNSKKRNNLDYSVEMPPVKFGLVSIDKSALPWNWRK